MVQSAGVAQIVSGSIPSPQRSRYGTAIDALASLAKLEVHSALVGRGSLEARRIVGTAPRAHHHSGVWRVELCMRRSESFRGPGILRRSASKMSGHVVVLSVGWHVNGSVYRLLVIAGHPDSDSGACGTTGGSQVRVCRNGATVVHLDGGDVGGRSGCGCGCRGSRQRHVLIVAAEVGIVASRLLIRCGLKE